MKTNSHANGVQHNASMHSIGLVALAFAFGLLLDEHIMNECAVKKQ